MPPPFRHRTTKKEPGARRGRQWFDAGAWSEDLADSYLALRRIDDAVRAISDATRGGHAEGAEMLCEPAEKLMRAGVAPG